MGRGSGDETDVPEASVHSVYAYVGYPFGLILGPPNLIPETRPLEK